MIKYCLQCGGDVERRIPDDDTVERHVCIRCTYIHYINPKVVVGCIPVWQDRVLICRRAIEPRRGLWTVPAGFLEIGETTEHGAMRETLEEANAEVTIGPLFSVVNVPHIGQVYMIYLAEMTSGDASPGAESLETVLALESEIPWDAIAFPTIEFALRRFFEDRRRGRFELHSTAITPAVRS